MASNIRSFLKPFLAFNKSKIVLKSTPTNYPTSTFSDIFTTEEEEARLLLWSMIYFIIRNDRNSLANFSKKRLRLIACDYSLCVERPQYLTATMLVRLPALSSYLFTNIFFATREPMKELEMHYCLFNIKWSNEKARNVLNTNTYLT